MARNLDADSRYDTRGAKPEVSQAESLRRTVRARLTQTTQTKLHKMSGITFQALPSNVRQQELVFCWAARMVYCEASGW